MQVAPFAKPAKFQPNTSDLYQFLVELNRTLVAKEAEASRSVAQQIMALVRDHWEWYEPFIVLVTSYHAILRRYSLQVTPFSRTFLRHILVRLPPTPSSFFFSSCSSSYICISFVPIFLPPFPGA